MKPQAGLEFICIAPGRVDSSLSFALECADAGDYAVDAQTCEFEDRTAVRGFDYYYYIEAYDDGSVDDQGRELSGSKFYTLTSSAAQLKRMRAPILRTSVSCRTPITSGQGNRRVGTGEGQPQHHVLQRPAKCRYKIYTERGDLIWEGDHVNNSGDEGLGINAGLSPGDRQRRLHRRNNRYGRLYERGDRRTLFHGR
ncbi:MAG: hypothetical protein U5N26_11245 [Candidatus Marinimicrobia bacterium]|nr:hypothetical protein [Candidatus Neomarinimicrobiota bacterium]